MAGAKKTRGALETIGRKAMVGLRRCVHKIGRFAGRRKAALIAGGLVGGGIGVGASVNDAFNKRRKAARKQAASERKEAKAASNSQPKTES